MISWNITNHLRTYNLKSLYRNLIRLFITLVCKLLENFCQSIILYSQVIIVRKINFAMTVSTSVINNKNS